MFTGLVQDIGTLRSLRRGERSIGFLIETALPTEELLLGESIAVQGVCLTVTSVQASAFTADVGPETLERTGLGRLRPGARVHLERALRADERLGGHIVQGHVDGVARVIENRRDGEAWQLRLQLPGNLLPEVVEKGSIALDGVSLTVNAVHDDVLRVTIIPFTAEKTTLTALSAGDAVNVETDILAKHVRRLLQFASPGSPGLGQLLARHDYLNDGDL